MVEIELDGGGQDESRRQAGTRNDRNKPMFIDKGTIFALLAIVGNLVATGVGVAFLAGKQDATVAAVERRIDDVSNRVDRLIDTMLDGGSRPVGTHR